MIKRLDQFLGWTRSWCSFGSFVEQPEIQRLYSGDSACKPHQADDVDDDVDGLLSRISWATR